MQVEDRLVLTERNFIEERNFQSELFLDEFAVVPPHGNHEISSIDQRSGQHSRDMWRWISALFDQPIRDDWMDGLRLGFGSSRFHSIGRLRADLCPYRILGRHTAEDVAGTYKEN